MAVFVAAGQPGAGGRGREAGMDALARGLTPKSEDGAEMRLRRGDAEETEEAESG
ncbi:hypothetical protein [Bacillus velezensis]|uniref:hypothetical protein n=1 Tax=Bacillus velezensis TaxID=492670 RepID=UPI0018E82DAF|nr:hypothetical protein [Bacillus velezensis]